MKWKVRQLDLMIFSRYSETTVCQKGPMAAVPSTATISCRSAIVWLSMENIGGCELWTTELYKQTKKKPFLV